MKKRFGKFSSLAIIGLLMFTGCLDILDSGDAIGSNYNPTAGYIAVFILFIFMLLMSLIGII